MIPRVLPCGCYVGPESSFWCAEHAPTSNTTSPKPTTTGAFVPLAILQDARHALVCSDAPKHLTDKLAALIREAESTK